MPKEIAIAPGVDLSKVFRIMSRRMKVGDVISYWKVN